eukprot:g6562.t1
MFRPYDLIATSVGPDVMDSLTRIGFLMGEAGLLEVMEAYHQYVKELPVFRINNGIKSNNSACVAKLLKIILIYIYGETIDPLPLKEQRQPYRHHNSGCMTRMTKASHIKVVHEYEGTGCLCGRERSCQLCKYCSYSKVEKLNALCEKAVKQLNSNGTRTSSIRELHTTRDIIFKNVWFKDNKY